jgi:hypothetical protein
MGISGISTIKKQQLSPSFTQKMEVFDQQEGAKNRGALPEAIVILDSLRFCW